MQLKNNGSFALMKKLLQLVHWNQLPLTLKIFVVLTFLSVIQYVWNLSFSRGYVAGIQPFAIKNNLALNYFFILFNLCLSIIFLYAVFKKNKQIFLYYIYWGLIYPPIALFLHGSIAASFNRLECFIYFLWYRASFSFFGSSIVNAIILTNNL